MKITLCYDFGPEGSDPFEYEAEINAGDYLADCLEQRYSSMQEFIDDVGDLTDDEKKRVLSCKNFKELSEVLWDIDEDWAESFVEEDDDYMDFLKDDLKEGFEDEALEEYESENDGCDPDGFYGWDDYYRWKNGSDCFNK